MTSETEVERPLSGIATPHGRISLIWPPGQVAQPGPPRLDGRTIADLDLHEVIQVLSGRDTKHEHFATAMLAELCADPETIRYRQEVVADLMENTILRDRLKTILADLQAMIHERTVRQRHAWSVTVIARRVSELEDYVQVATDLLDALRGGTQAPPARAAALCALRDYLEAHTSTPSFRALQAELPRLRATLAQLGSITIGINLTKDLSPESATVLSLNTEKVEGRAPLLERLFGKDGPRALSPLYDVDISSARNALYRDVLKLLEAVVTPVEQAIGRYATENAYALTELEPELFFLLNGVVLANRLVSAGLPICQPALIPMPERVTYLEEGYNPSLALRMLAQARTEPWQDGAPVPVITNRVTLGADGARIWILTGPNRGGKTTFTRAAGLAHVLFQAGLHVPARSGRMSPVDAIYTHFPAAESNELGTGKLDEEAQRLARIFQVASPHGLILLNEVLAGTSAIEALGLATDAVRGLRLLGARAIYTTHLHELAARVDEVNASTPGDSLVGSLVAGVEADGQSSGSASTVIGPRHRRTFRVFPSPPQNVSYASEIAEQHGISYSQLVLLFRERGVTAEA